MAKKTFISYKYDEARELRDKIINALGDDAKYYKGEGGYSEDLTGCRADTIKRYLSNMIYDTSVTIVIVTPNMTESAWISWEVNYSLRKETRNGRQSQPNKLILVFDDNYCSDLAYGCTDVNKIYKYLGINKGDYKVCSMDCFLHNIHDILNSI